ncbi:hypothetical protein JHK82_012253 [Glycine max]|nr:hypothetical protein JHK82_012253 [Glycine max]
MEIIGHLWIQVDAIYVSNDYHSSLMLRPNCENNIVNVSWRHPPSDSFKLNCDASVQPQCKKAFIEGVFRNHFGNSFQTSLIPRAKTYLVARNPPYPCRYST